MTFFRNLLSNLTFDFLLTIFLASHVGHSSPLPDSRIIGGHPASVGEFPYQVSIQAYDRASRDFIPICGGAILNPTTILSAAHCTLVDPDGLYRVVAGEHDLSREEGSEQYRLVEHIVVHNGFDDFSYQNDIAIYLLSPTSPLVFGKQEKVGGVGLPPSKSYVAAGSAIVAGWGVTSDAMLLQPLMEDGATESNVLNKVTVPFYPDGKCEQIYGQDFVKEMMFCAGNLDGGQDACAGDSGGPLVSYYSGEKIVAGLVSWGPGTGCGQKGYLGVYTRVSNYVEWIRYVIKVLGHEYD